MGFFDKLTENKEEKKQKYEKWLQEVYEPLNKIVVTTCDIHDHKYQIIRPCFYQVSNKGWFNDKLMGELKDPAVKRYLEETRQEKEKETAAKTYTQEEVDAWVGKLNQTQQAEKDFFNL